MKDKIKVLYINHESHGEGGSTASLINMINAVKEFVEPVILVRSKNTYEKINSKGLRCYYYHFSQNIADKHKVRGLFFYVIRWVRDMINDYICIISLLHDLKGERIDIVHSNSSVVRIGINISRKLNAKHVIHLREFIDLDFGTHPFFGWKSIYNIIKKSDYVISITQSIFDHWKVSDLNNSSKVIWNAVRSLDQIVPLQDEKEKYILFCAARVTANKGIFDALEIFRMSNLPSLGYILKVAGNVEDSVKLTIEKLLIQYNLLGKVEYIGYLLNIDPIMRNSSAFLMCSKNEALGRVTVEAMFSGCPIIGKNSGGTKELIKHSFNGYLYNSVEEGSSYLDTIIMNKEKTLQMISNARLFAEDNFTEESYKEKIKDIYVGLCN